MVSAYTFKDLDCSSDVKIGINAEDLSKVYSPDCVKSDNRIWVCECQDEIRMLSRDKGADYNLIVTYSDYNDVPKIKSLYNIRLADTKVDKSIVTFFVVFLVALIFTPILILVVLMFYFNKKLKVIKNGAK